MRSSTIQRENFFYKQSMNVMKSEIKFGMSFHLLPNVPSTLSRQINVQLLYATKNSESLSINMKNNAARLENSISFIFLWEIA